MSIASFPPAACHSITPTGLNHAIGSFFPSRCSVASSVASSLPVSGRPSVMACSAQDLRRLATATVPKGLGGLRKTALRWSRVFAPLLGPLHPSRSHLYSSLVTVHRRDVP